MKKLVLSALFSVVTSASVFAASLNDFSFSVGSKIGSSVPCLQLGVHHAYADARLGFGVSSYDNGNVNTSETDISIQVGGKYPLAQDLNITGGVGYTLVSGTDVSGAIKVDIDSASVFSVYTGLQKSFGKNLVVEAQLNLFDSSSMKLKVADAKTLTQTGILNSANLIVSYVF
jgi:hypothetical protein